MNQAKLDTIHDIIARLEVSKSEARKEFAEQVKAMFKHEFDEDICNVIDKRIEGLLSHDVVKGV